MSSSSVIATNHSTSGSSDPASNPSRIAAPYREEQFLSLMGHLAQQIQSMQTQIAAVTGMNESLQRQVDLRAQENQTLQQQADGRQSQLNELTQRVTAVSTDNAALASQVAQEQRQRQDAESARVQERQHWQQQVRASLLAEERTRLQARLVECETALTALDQNETHAQTALGLGSAGPGAFWGAIAAGPIGAAVGLAIGAAVGSGIGASEAASKNAVQRDALNRDIQIIKARLLVLPST